MIFNNVTPVNFSFVEVATRLFGYRGAQVSIPDKIKVVSVNVHGVVS